MPEKAFKMQGWIMVGRFMESKFEDPTISKWVVAGAAAGAATSIIGEWVSEAGYYNHVLLEKCVTISSNRGIMIILLLSDPAHTHT